MLKKIILLMCFILIASSLSGIVSADDTTRHKVEEIINGNQDYLVLANIIEKGTLAYEVQVFEEIGFPHGTPETDDNDAKSEILDLRINVEGFENYMYYDGFDYRPQKGDNVLLSLEFNGNSYTIKNGAYRVDSTSHEQFSFMVPESFNGSEEALELNALYIYIHSNGEINNLTIKDGAVYGKDANGEEKKMEISGGLKFIDEFGDTSEKLSPVEIYGQGSQEQNQSKWRIALAIIVFGAVVGAFVVKLTKKFEKRYD